MSREREAVQTKRAEINEKWGVQDTSPVPTELETKLNGQSWNVPTLDPVEKMVNGLWPVEQDDPESRLRRASMSADAPRDLFGRLLRSENMPDLSARIRGLANRTSGPRYCSSGEPVFPPNERRYRVLDGKPYRGERDDPEPVSDPSILPFGLNLLVKDSPEARQLLKERQLEREMLASAGLEECGFCRGTGKTGVSDHFDIREELPCTFCGAEGVHAVGRWDSQADSA